MKSAQQKLYRRKLVSEKLEHLESVASMEHHQLKNELRMRYFMDKVGFVFRPYRIAKS